MFSINRVTKMHKSGSFLQLKSTNPYFFTVNSLLVQPETDQIKTEIKPWKILHLSWQTFCYLLPELFDERKRIQSERKTESERKERHADYKYYISLHPRFVIE